MPRLAADCRAASLIASAGLVRARAVLQEPRAQGQRRRIGNATDEAMLRAARPRAVGIVSANAARHAGPARVSPAVRAVSAGG